MDKNILITQAVRKQSRIFMQKLSIDKSFIIKINILISLNKIENMYIYLFTTMMVK